MTEPRAVPEHFWRERPVLLSGGTGLVGSALAEYEIDTVSFLEGFRATTPWYRDHLQDTGD